MLLYVINSCECVASENDIEDQPEYMHTWSEQWEFNVHSVHLNSQESGIFGDCETIGVYFEDIKVGDPVYVLYTVFSTGDSFGTASGKGEVIWVFQSQQLAQQALTKLNANPKSSLSFEVDGGNTIKMSSPCEGYFENDGEFYLKELQVKH